MHVRSRGMTLMEMLVVLAIAGMALALGFQSLGQWQRAERAIARVSDAGRAAVLSQAWWEDSVRGIVLSGDTPFEGRADGFSGHTLAATLATPGATTALAWRLEQGVDGMYRLTLEEAGQSLSLALPDAGAARFLYLDQDGRTHAQWPPALGEQRPLPRAVALIQDLGEDQRLWLSALSGPLEQVELPFQPEMD